MLKSCLLTYTRARTLEGENVAKRTSRWTSLARGGGGGGSRGVKRDLTPTRVAGVAPPLRIIAVDDAGWTFAAVISPTAFSSASRWLCVCEIDRATGRPID